MEFWWVFGIFLLVILVVVVIGLIRATTRGVPAEKRWVIYRFGRFDRVVGPGPVPVFPWLDQVEGEFEVRDRPMEVLIPGIFAFGAPNDLTLHFWCRFDPAKAIGKDREKLAPLVRLSDSERRQQVEVKLRESLVRQAAELQKQKPLPGTPTLLDGVAALAPGSERMNDLLQNLVPDLAQNLLLIGFVLNTTQPIALTKRSVGEDIIKAIKRKYGRDIDSQWLTRYADDLRQKFPDISGTMLAQVLSAIEGVDAGQVHRLLLDQDKNPEIEFEMPGDSSGAAPNVIAKPKLRSNGAETERQASVASVTSPPSGSPVSVGLTKSDLAVLKRIPRQQNQRLSA